MIILKVAVGNKKEAFIEERFTENINFILSNENNRGKTIVFQSLMYAIGNEPIFPKGFIADNYYHYCEFSHNQKKYKVLRKKLTFIIKEKETGSLLYCNSVEEFRDWFDKNIYSLPKFRNDNGVTKADLPLFYQLFFLPQDGRNTSNIINHGYRNKNDFIALVKALLIPENEDLDYEILKELKDKKKKLESSINILLRKNEFIKNNREIAASIFSSVDRIESERIEKEIAELNKEIADVSNKIRREDNRKNKLISLLTELNSANRLLTEGKLVCADCGSNKIVFDINDAKFDLTNDYVRNQIINSVRNKIEEKSQLSDDLSNKKYKLKEKLEELIISQPHEISDYLLFKVEIEKTKETNENIKIKQNEIENIKNQIKTIEEKENKRNTDVKELYEKLLYQMRESVRKIDPNSAFFIDDLFTKNKENFSGSEGQIFYFAKIYILVTFLKLPFPIIIDSFRDGELSSNREEIMLEEFSKIDNQIILSATLKNEEYDISKYQNYSKIHVIDYSEVEDCKLLKDTYVSGFMEIITDFGIEIT
ncbi:MAG: hypothetical protein IKZ86_12750 [Spirochaetaceae bacterium]|nr:hypothetical protein [Spirochaetaceae bacterium]